MSLNPAATPSPHPSALSRMIAEAGRHLDQADYAPAIEILERAHRLDTANCKLLLDLGYANAVASSPVRSLKSVPTSDLSRAGRVISPVASLRPIMFGISASRTIVSSARPHTVRDGTS